MRDYERSDLKEYRGYGIEKAFQITWEGKKVPGTTIYNVSEDEEYIGEEFKTLSEAKAFIDSIA